MLRYAMLLLLTALATTACKTSNFADKSFELGDDTIAAQQLIVDTVVKNYPDTTSHRAIVAQFAKAILKGRDAGAQTPEELLKLYHAKHDLRKDKETDFDRYVVQEFVALTNYIAFKTVPKTPLAYLGNTSPRSPKQPRK